MDIAVALFDQVTALDAIGPYEVLQRLPGARLCFVGHNKGEVRTDRIVKEECLLRYDPYVGGKIVQRKLAQFAAVEEQTATAAEISSSVTSSARTVKDVADTAGKSATLVNEIAKATDEASKTASEVARHVDELSRGVQEVAVSSVEAAKGVSEISNNVQFEYHVDFLGT